MDNFKFRKFQKLFILGFVLIFIVSSCKKDEEEHSGLCRNMGINQFY